MARRRRSLRSPRARASAPPRVAADGHVLGRCGGHRRPRRGANGVAIFDDPSPPRRPARDARRRRHRHRDAERHADHPAGAHRTHRRDHGVLGGLRVESEPDPVRGVVLVASIPRGGDRFGDVRAGLERWRPIERRPRLGVGIRVLSGAGVVAAVFFCRFSWTTSSRDPRSSPRSWCSSPGRWRAGRCAVADGAL